MEKGKRFGSLIYSVLPTDVEGIDDLAELALDLRWSWNHVADELWRQLDPILWQYTHNPWVILQTVSRNELGKAMADPSFRTRLDQLMDARRREAATPGWFEPSHPRTPLTSVVYFSMEFMLSEALPIYSGGLGNVAGDQLKAAGDLGVPVIGVGLLYQQGYFRQVIDKNGAQQALFPYNDPGQLPILPVHEQNGEWLRLGVALPGYPLWLRVWQAQVGRVKLYLLDSNDPANFPVHRGITSELYGGGPELRLKQELVLGIGGWMLLEALGIKPEVCHLNEGHAAFAVLERARSFMESSGQPFDVALTVTRAGNLFTTHTPVAAGFDLFAPSLMEQYLRVYAEKRLGISFHDMMALGRLNPGDPSEPFNMAYLAVRGSGAVNGVSRLHGKVSRRIFEHLFPRWPESEVPIGFVTNGVHMPSWDSAEAAELWTESCGEDLWLEAEETLQEIIRAIPDSQLWRLRSMARKSLIEFIRERLYGQLSALGASSREVENAGHVFSPGTLTLGFARRFAAYKRPNLLLHDPGRLLRILTDTQRPAQLIIAGKAHPADQTGQDMIRQWTHFIRRAGVQSHVVFVGDYDMLLTRRMVQGVDVWLNTPRRPWEACGTSGMKVLVNGGINLSELDGWWAEAYAPEVGWALGDGGEHGDDPAWDAAEAESLYDLLEREVIPEFYARDETGIPAAWVNRMRESMARLTPRFSAGRTVREYTERYYVPAAAAYLERAADKGAVGADIVKWTRALEENWSTIGFGRLRARSEGEEHVFEVTVDLHGLDPNGVRVELYAEGLNGGEPERREMALAQRPTGAENGHIYGTRVPAARPISDYSVRLIPHYPGVSIPLEAAEILWQH
jgi:glycogen phosphorylase